MSFHLKGLFEEYCGKEYPGHGHGHGHGQYIKKQFLEEVDLQRWRHFTGLDAEVR